MSTEYFVVGRVRRAHGIRGELVVEATTDTPDAIFAAGGRVFAGTRDGSVSHGAPEVRILRSSPFKGGLIVAIDGVNDRTTADSWRDRTFLVPSDEVSPPTDDQLFIHELVGMRVVRVNGEDVGEVTQVFDLPQGPLMEVSRASARPVLLPFNDQTVTEVDAELRVVRVNPIDGLID